MGAVQIIGGERHTLLSLKQVHRASSSMQPVAGHKPASRGSVVIISGEVIGVDRSFVRPSGDHWGYDVLRNVVYNKIVRGVPNLSTITHVRRAQRSIVIIV